jgi:hypothetical protein
MSIQSEINRIKGNVDDTLSALSGAGVAVPANANSDDLPALVNELGSAVIPVERGGTGATAVRDAAQNLSVPSLLGGTKIPTGADLNDYKTVGTYYSNTYKSTSNLANCPTNNPFTMTVSYACGDSWYTSQEIVDFQEGVRYFRMGTGSGTWYNWQTSYSTAYKPSADGLSGTMSVAKGGTGASTAAAALANLGAASKAELEEVKTSVGEGKALIASAVTDKGVATADDATFAQMAANIAAIPSGGGGGETVTLTIKSLGPMGITGVLCYTDGEGKSQLATTKGTVTALKGSYASCINGGDGTMQTGNPNLYSGAFGSGVFVVEADGVVKI